MGFPPFSVPREFGPALRDRPDSPSPRTKAPSEAQPMFDTTECRNATTTPSTPCSLGRRSRLRCFLTATVVLLSLTPIAVAQAHDDQHRRIGGDKLKVLWSVENPKRGKFQFQAKNQLQINEAPFEADPTAEPSSLVVRSMGESGFTTGTIALAPERWSIANNGRSWSYKSSTKDPQGRGVSKIRVKQGKQGGSLQIKAKGSFWDFPVLEEQDGIQIFLRIGSYSFCAEYSEATNAEFRRNEMGRVDGKFAAPPAECGSVCGNAILELGETCDDGNSVASDTCNNDCEGCDATDIEFSGSFEGIQSLIFDSPTYNCSNDTCHGAAKAGNLDLRAQESFAQLLDVAADANPEYARVFPGDENRSLLYLKLASATLGEPAADTIPGAPMPLGGTPLTEAHLEALRLWIRGGAPESTTVDGTAAFLNSCLPSPSPLKMPQPDVPPLGEGVQFTMPAFDLASQEEREVCVASYYDLTTPGLVPESAIVDCAGQYPGTNDHGSRPGKCFAYERNQIFQDPQSHHNFAHIYGGHSDYDDQSWGDWRCYKGDDHGLACNPASASPCAGGGTCGGPATTTVSCIGFGPEDFGFLDNNAEVWSRGPGPTFDTQLPSGVYALLPLKGLVVWNAHGFNLTVEDMKMEAWVNLTFADDTTFRAQPFFNYEANFTQNVLPFSQQEYCHTHTFAENTHLFSLFSHTHKRGVRWRYYLPPNTPCVATPDGSADPGCSPGNTEDIFYESFDYSDPLHRTFSPSMVFSGTTEQRTVKFCSLYDNGFTDPSLVKLQSTSPTPSSPGQPGGPCQDSDTYCTGGPNQGQPCFGSALDCPGATCDACPLRGGMTTDDEMFIATGTFYLP